MDINTNIYAGTLDLKLFDSNSAANICNELKSLQSNCILIMLAY